MSNVKNILAGVGFALLPNVVLADAKVQTDCGLSTAVFSGDIETFSGYDDDGSPIGPIQINLDGTYPAEPLPVSEMTMARFNYQSCFGDGMEETLLLNRRQVAESLLLHTVLENPSPDLITQEITFGAQYITTDEEALDSLKELKNSLMPHDSLITAFDAFSEATCPASEYQYLKGTETAGLTRSSYNRIEVDVEFLGANFVCPTLN